jgi:hypothetical protein
VSGLAAFTYSPAVVRIGEGHTARSRRALLVFEAITAAGLDHLAGDRIEWARAVARRVLGERTLEGYGEIAAQLGEAVAALRRDRECQRWGGGAP